MKKSALLILAVLLAITLLFVACDKADDPQQPVDSTESSTTPETEAHVHAFGEWTTVKASTCTEQGEQERTCECGEAEKQALDALGHTEVVDTAVAPTCTQTGLTDGKHCSVCNEVLIAQEVVDALGHTPAEAVKENTVSSGCTTEGSYDLAVYCTVCDVEISRENQKVDVLGHTEVVDAAVAPTCTATGLTEGSHCSVCNEVLVAQTEVAALGHTEVIDEVVAPTCTQTGLTEGKHCSVCNEILIAQESVDALGHTEVVDAAVAPTCTETGLTEGKHCSVCNEVLIAQENIEALGHSSVTIAVTPPTATENGCTTYACTTCGYIYTEEFIPIEFSVTSDNRAMVGYTGVESEHLEILAVFEDNGAWYRVTSIGYSAFEDCDNLVSVVIPSSVTSIGSSAFYHCSNMTSIYIPCGVTIIESAAFMHCSALTDIVIPDSVTSIGDGAFQFSNSLTSIVVSDGNTVYHSDGNCLIETDSKTLILGCNNSILPQNGSVMSIGSGAFANCWNLTSIVIPDSVTSIGDRAFDCSGLTSIVIPDSVTSIGVAVFSSCSRLESIVVSNGNTAYRSDGNCLIETESKTLIIGFYNSVIPSDGSVTSIGDSAFSGCYNLTSIVIPDGVTSIGNSAFSNCSLTSIVIPDSVTSIGEWAFSGCTSLTSVTIPDSMTSISDYAFNYCTALTDVYYAGTEEGWVAITIGLENEYLTNATIHYNWTAD